MMGEFDPGRYADTRREQIMDLLKKKAMEKAPVQAPAVEEEEGEGPADLIAALEESMRQVKQSR